MDAIESTTLMSDDKMLRFQNAQIDKKTLVNKQQTSS